MGCINNVKIKDKKCTYIVRSNQLKKEVIERRKYSHPINEHIFSKRDIEDISRTVISQSIDDLIENNPLPFVKIKRKNNHL